MDFKPNKIEKYLKIIEDTIISQPDDIQIQMNGFVASVGCQIIGYQERCIELYKKYLDQINIDYGDTSCKLMDTEKHITSTVNRNRVGVVRKSCRC